jgi:hypothetical protein
MIEKETSRISDWTARADVGGVIGFRFPAGNPALFGFQILRKN